MNLKIPSSGTKSEKSANQATKKHLRGSTLLLAGRLIAMGTNFAVQVLIVRYLSKSDYGAFAYAMSLISLGSSLVVFGLDKTVTRYLPIYQERGERAKTAGTILMVVAAILGFGLLLAVLVFLLQGWLSPTLIDDPEAVKLLVLSVLLVPVQALGSLLVGLLAIFAKPSAIFFRRHVVGPGLKLLVVLLLMLLGYDVYFLAVGYVAAGVLGLVLYSGILVRDLHHQGMGKYFNLRVAIFPVKEIFGFTVPLFTTNMVYVLRSQLVIILLGYYQTTREVASYRAVQPVADLNTMVIQSFGLLFMPTIARLFAKEEHDGINDIYWQTAIWITIITFPVFLATFSLAEPFTVFLFGKKYAQSGLIMALLALGYYFNAALGFNADTLRVYGRIRYTLTIDFVSMLISVALSFILVPQYGAVGAAIATCGTLVLYNILNQLGLRFATRINFFQLRYFTVYLSVVLGAIVLFLFQRLVSNSIYLDLALAALISLIVLVVNRSFLQIEHTFPELLRFPVVRFLFETRPNKAGLSNEEQYKRDNI